jgi:hypothetical protein
MTAHNNPFVVYYLHQVTQGRGMRGGNYTPTVFRGKVYQRGKGFASFFSKLFRKATPVIMPFLKQVGREAGMHLAKTGLQLGEDMLAGQASFKRDAGERFRNAGKDIASMTVRNLRQQTGLGGIPKQSRVGKRKVYKEKKSKNKRQKLSHTELFG